MKRHLSYIAVALAAPAFVLGSCKQVSVEEPEQAGYLYVSLDRDDSEDLVFKSAPADDMTFSLPSIIWQLLSKITGILRPSRSD